MLFQFLELENALLNILFWFLLLIHFLVYLPKNYDEANDILKLIGKPHTKSIKNEDTWIYFERTITRGKLIKLGQNVLKENNVLALEFDRFGILKNKKIYNKKDMKKIAYSSKETSNEITQQSFVNKFLSSIRQKMYGKRKF